MKRASYSVDRHRTAIWRVKDGKVHVATTELQWWDESILPPGAVMESIGNYWHSISEREAKRLFPKLFKRTPNPMLSK